MLHDWGLYLFICDLCLGACFDIMPPMIYQDLCMRMGAVLGFCCPWACSVPFLGDYDMDIYNVSGRVSDSSRHLLTKVNHTGSDVRVTSGVVLNPKAFPRQSACAAWWIWQRLGDFLEYGVGTKFQLVPLL